MKKFFTSLLIGIVLIVGIFSLAKNVIVKVVAERGVEAVTGLPLRIQNIDISFTKTSMGITQLLLFNPAGFPEKIMIDIPDIFVDFNLGALLKRKKDFNEVRIHLQEFVVVKNEEGMVNLDSLKALRKTEKKGETETRPARKAVPFHIDVLELKIGKVIYKDYSQKPPSVREFHVNYNERYTDIENADALVKLIVFKALSNTAIDSLINFDLNTLKGAVTGTLKTATDLTTGTVKTTADILKKTAKGLTDVIKIPFK